MKTLQIVVSVFLLISSIEGKSGDLTYYCFWNQGYGSCGLDISMHNKFYVAALSRAYMKVPPDGNPNHCAMCADNVCIKVTGAKGSVVLKVSDTCEGCKTDDVDIADTVFPMLDDPAKGRVPCTWDFVDCGSNPPGFFEPELDNHHHHHHHRRLSKSMNLTMSVSEEESFD
jgi:hypothetical protein